MPATNDTFYLMNFSSINRAEPNTLNFANSVVVDGLRLMSTDNLMLQRKPPYYGDEVDLIFWKSMNLMIGRVLTPTPYTLISGWSYVYNHTKNTFTVKDNTNTLVELIENVHSIGDMKIDFTVIKSHQFLIVLDIDDESTMFIKTAYASFVHDGADMDSVNYDINIRRLDILSMLTVSEDRQCYNESLVQQEEKIFYKMPELSFINILEFKDAPLYVVDDMGIRDATSIPLNWTTFVQNMTYGTLIPTNSSNNLFPARMPIEKIGETRNNRPCYEPYMIWGDYDFIYAGIIVDEIDEFRFRVFDLSPNYS